MKVIAARFTSPVSSSCFQMVRRCIEPVVQHGFHNGSSLYSRVINTQASVVLFINLGKRFVKRSSWISQKFSLFWQWLVTLPFPISRNSTRYDSHHLNLVRKNSRVIGIIDLVVFKILLTASTNFGFSSRPWSLTWLWRSKSFLCVLYIPTPLQPTSAKVLH